MKFNLAIIFSFIFTWGNYAQSSNDALLFSSEDLSGTARFVAMGGAFGALGGDISSLKVNPAGSSVFLHNFASFSLANESYENDVLYQGSASNRSNNNFFIPQAGAVFVFNNSNPDANVSKFTIGITYDQKKSLDNRFNAAGNNESSIGDYFVDLANGVPLDLLNSFSLQDRYIFLGEGNFNNEGFSNTDLQNAFLGYNAFLFDPVSDDTNNTSYTSNVNSNSVFQDYNYRSTGLNGKFSVNGSMQLFDNFYAGLNLNSHFINYERSTSYYESIGGSSEINEVVFQNNLSTIGIGFSFQVGAIAKVNEFLRLGASYESPTWYTISDETSQYLYSYSNEFGGQEVDPFVTNIFPNYRLRTPGKLVGSLGLVFGKTGILSFDYSYKDYSNMQLSPGYDNNTDYRIQNQNFENNFDAASTYRLGGEYRIQRWSLRGGYRYEESPNSNTVSELNGYSGGLGYDFGKLRLDFAYDYSSQDYNANLLQTGIQERASVDFSRSNYILTLAIDM